MILKLKSKTPVLVDPFRNISTNIYIKIDVIVFNGIECITPVLYYYETNNNSVITIKNVDTRFSISQIEEFQSTLGISSTSVLENLVELMGKITMSELDRLGLFGLSSIDYEVCDE